ncbi:hypothetical protein HanOQP8_Chr06g0231731 [Helianthus annuus]|nr:hypothetical protein HanOQP8_Chr06g0231731 [Helianthus annuus]
MVTTPRSWKDRFFWVSESTVPFKVVWRYADVVLNELEPSESELDNWFLKSIRACASRLCPFPEHLLVLIGISKLWDKPDRDPVLMRDVMSALAFIKSDDTSDVVFMDAEATEGDDAVVHGAEHRFLRDSCSSMDDDQMISKMMLGAYNLVALLPDEISRFRKRMQEYEAFSKKRDGMKASMAALKKVSEGFAEKEKLG